MIDMVCDKVSVFIGPEGYCYVEAIVAESRDIPMISYVSKSISQCFMKLQGFNFQKCSDYRVSHLKTFARTEPQDTQVSMHKLKKLEIHSFNINKSNVELISKQRILYLQYIQDIKLFKTLSSSRHQVLQNIKFLKASHS